ncbi:MAG TPA: hypothetical protein VND64_13195, partial [Pirellulales bacterium]|nr:hypothetical protein [Pirellulales bacterium]
VGTGQAERKVQDGVAVVDRTVALMPRRWQRSAAESGNSPARWSASTRKNPQETVLEVQQGKAVVRASRGK